MSGALLLLARRSIFGGSFAPLPGLLGRVLAFGPFAAAVLRDAAVGTWYVTLAVLHLRPLERPGIVAGGTLETTALVALIFAGSALSFMYAFQVYQRAFLAREDGNNRRPSPRATRVLAISLAAFVLAIGFWPEPLLVLGEESAALLSEGLK